MRGRRKWRWGYVGIALALAAAGCATKGFVREEAQKAEAKAEQQKQELEKRITSQQEQMAAQERSVADLGRKVEGIDVRVGEVQGEAARAGTLAKEAKDAAGTTLAKAQESDERLSRKLRDRNKATALETVQIQFGFNRWDLRDQSITALQEIAKILKADPNRIVELEGYTDSIGPDEYNLRLGQRRAEEVARFLVIQHGVEPHRIHRLAIGKGNPIADNKTAEGRAQNRRVTVRILALGE